MKAIRSLEQHVDSLIFGDYDKLTDDIELKDAFNDFKKRYKNKIKYSYNIMSEDWFLLVEAFFL